MDFKLGNNILIIDDKYIPAIVAEKAISNEIDDYKEIFEEKLEDECETVGDALDTGRTCLIVTAKNIVEKFVKQANKSFSDDAILDFAIQIVDKDANKVLKDLPDEVTISSLKLNYSMATDTLRKSLVELFPYSYNPDKKRFKTIMDRIGMDDYNRDQWDKASEETRKTMERPLSMDQRNLLLIKALNFHPLSKGWFDTYLYRENFYHEEDVLKLANLIFGEKFKQSLYNRNHIRKAGNKEFEFVEGSSIVYLNKLEDEAPSYDDYFEEGGQERLGRWANTMTSLHINEIKDALQNANVYNIKDFEELGFSQRYDIECKIKNILQTFKLGQYLKDSNEHNMKGLLNVPGEKNTFENYYYEKIAIEQCVLDIIDSL